MNQTNVEQVKALAVFTRQLSGMIDVGINLACSLWAMGSDAPEPYDRYSRDVVAAWNSGDERTLFATMEDEPELFSQFYVNMVRWGEVGAILQESLAQLAELLEDMLKTWALVGKQSDWLRYVMPGESGTPDDWHELDWRHRKFILMVFCRSLGHILGAGVPFFQAVDTVSGFIPEKQRAEFRDGLRDHINNQRMLSDYLASMELMPAFVVKMVEIGERGGFLDITLQKAALAYQKQLELEAL